jgi:hypothetical protein
MWTKMAVDLKAHPFFGVQNIRVLQQQIVDSVRRFTGKTVDVPVDDAFVRSMVQVAEEYSVHLRAARTEFGVAQLNDVVVRRAVRTLTVPEIAGRYEPGNRSQRNDRRGKYLNGNVREPEADLVDPVPLVSNRTLDNPQRALTARWAQEDRERREYMLANDKFRSLWAENNWTPDRRRFRF